MAIEWPAEFARTDPDDRDHCRKFEASLADTTSDIETQMGRLDAAQWRAETGSGGAHVRSNGLPKYSANPDDPGFVLRWTKDGEQFAVVCDAHDQLRDNCREVLLWVEETRLRGQRPVETGESEFAAARLPSGKEDVVVAGAEPAHEVLGVAPDASDKEVEAAFRERAKVTHADTSGSSEEFKRVLEAREVLLDG